MAEINTPTTVQVSRRTKLLLKHLCESQPIRVSYTAMIDALVEGAILDPNGVVKAKSIDSLINKLDRAESSAA